MRALLPGSRLSGPECAAPVRAAPERWRPKRTRAGASGAAAALAALLTLSACAMLGADTPDPLASDAADRAEASADAPPSPDDGAVPLPVPRPAPGASEAADGEADIADADDQLAAAEAGRTAGAAADDGLAADAEPADAAQATANAAAAATAPHVYMSLQPDRTGATSVIFAIDRSRDGTPSDEPAIRITPEEVEAQTGRCNPQQLRYYKFPPESAGEPVYGPEEASRGVDARTLPEFMATAVSAEMMERGLAADLEATRPQNVCTRKLFEQTIIAATTGQG